MKRFTDPDDLATRPAAPPVLALAWAVVAAQSAYAACAWALCLGVGMIAHRLGTRSATPLAAPPAPRNLRAPTQPLARRRTDAVASRASARPAPAEPLLKAHRDQLAGLSTPEFLADSGERWAQDLQARGQGLCVLHLGLDGFEPVVERYGQDAGHQVLVQAARRLRHLTRNEDKVVRLRDSEFVLLLSGPADESKAFLYATKARVAAEMQRPFTYRTLSNLHIHCSVGFALLPLNGASLHEAMQHAEEALAAARSRQAALSRQALVA